MRKQTEHVERIEKIFGKQKEVLFAATQSLFCDLFLL